MKFELINEGDEDCNLWVAIDSQNNAIASGRDRSIVETQAANFFRALSTNSPNFENSEIAFLCKN